VVPDADKAGWKPAIRRNAALSPAVPGIAAILAALFCWVPGDAAAAAKEQGRLEAGVTGAQGARRIAARALDSRHFQLCTLPFYFALRDPPAMAPMT
jgi:hypothetical protein